MLLEGLGLGSEFRFQVLRLVCFYQAYSTAVHCTLVARYFQVTGGTRISFQI